jgi:hypothetical protein
MDNQDNFWYIISKRDPNSIVLHISSWEFPVTYPQISSISYDFGDKLNQKGPTKAEFQNLNFLIFCPILMQILFFGKMIIFMRYWCQMVPKNCCCFILKMDLMGPIFRHLAYLEGKKKRCIFHKILMQFIIQPLTKFAVKLCYGLVLVSL